MSVDNDPCCCPSTWSTSQLTYRTGVLTLLCNLATYLAASIGFSDPAARSISSSTALENSRIIKNSPGVLYALSGYNSLASIQFIQLFDSLTVPAETAVPLLTYSVPASSNFNIPLPPDGLYFATGIVVVNSTTGPTKTIGAANVFFTAQYK